MKRIAIVILLNVAALHLQTQAQNASNPPQPGNRPPRAQDGRGSGRPEEPQSLTTEQKARVKSILSRYNANTLTADQAKAIHAELRQAGIPGGPAENEAVKAAGFDPEKLRDLDPPPAQAGGREQPPERGPDRPQSDAARPEPRERGQQNRYTIEQAISDPRN